MSLKECFVSLPIIETISCVLRNLEVADAHNYGECIANPDIYKYWGRDMSDMEKNIIGRIERNYDELKKCRELTWGIALKDSNKVIGEIVIFNFDGTRTQKAVIAEIAFRIAPQYWNKGITTEAIGGIIRYMFQKTGIKRIYACVMCENISSIRVLEKNGFCIEGRIRSGKIANTICDYYILSILKSGYIVEC